MGRSPCCDPKDGLKKGPWTPEEDMKLTQYIHTHGPGNWRNLPKNAGLQRCGKSCRLRWTNYLRPDIKRGRFSFDEEETIIQLHSVLGNKWSAIAARLPGRTDNEIKNYWNTHIRKRLLRSGIDPVTHAPRLDFFDLSSLLNSPQLDLSNLLRLQTLLNPEALRLALSILSSSNNENPNSLLQKIQDNQFLNSQDQDHDHTLQFQPNQFENLVNQQIPSNITNLPLPSQDNNMGHVSLVRSTNSNGQNQMFQDYVPTTTSDDQSLPTLNISSNFFYGANSDQIKGDLSSENSSFDNSVLSTPSTSTFVNGSNIEDESFCSNLLRFEIPESLDLDDFM